MKHEEYLRMQKFEGCAEKIKEKRTLEYELPLIEKDVGSVDHLHPELRLMAKMMTDSVSNALLKIEYQLDVYVKHLSKTEFGMGNFVSFKIEVKSGAVDLPWF